MFSVEQSLAEKTLAAALHIFLASAMLHQGTGEVEILCQFCVWQTWEQRFTVGSSGRKGEHCTSQRVWMLCILT